MCSRASAAAILPTAARRRRQRLWIQHRVRTKRGKVRNIRLTKFFSKASDSINCLSPRSWQTFSVQIILFRRFIKRSSFSPSLPSFATLWMIEIAAIASKIGRAGRCSQSRVVASKCGVFPRHRPVLKRSPCPTYSRSRFRRRSRCFSRRWWRFWTSFRRV